MLLSRSVIARYRQQPGATRHLAAGMILALILVAAIVGIARSGNPFADHHPTPAACEIRESSERTPNCP
jgi:hypothetical protein